MSRAEDAVDKVVAVTPALKNQRLFACRTLTTHYVGFEGFSDNLQARLIQKYNVTSRVAHRLARAYGGRAVEVVKIARELAEQKKARQEKRRGSSMEDSNSRNEYESDNHALMEQFARNLDPEEVLLSESYTGEEALLVPDYPIIEAEVVFGVRHDWVVRPEDFLARRCRLAFLNKDVALRAIPRVVQLMAQELHWNRARQSAEMQRCVEFMRHFGGSKPVLADSSVRLATRADLLEVFRKAKPPQVPGLTRYTLQLASEMLNHVLTPEELEDCLQYAESLSYAQALSGQPGAAVAPHTHGVVGFEAFAGWWNSDRLNAGLTDLKESKSAKVSDVQGSGAMFG